MTWQVRAAGSSAWTTVTGATGTTLTFAATAGQHRNSYRAVASNGVGSVARSSAALLTVTR